MITLGRTAAASNVYLVGSASAWVLVDAGWVSSAKAITAAAESLFGAGTSPAAIVLTHIHPDHSGAAGTLARSWGVPVYVHPAELAMAPGRYRPEYGMPLDRWVVMPLMRLLPARTRTRIEQSGSITDVVRSLDATGGVPGLEDWQWVHTPGHTPGHVAYLRRSDGVLISGDAVLTVDLNSLTGMLTRRHGIAPPPRYSTWDWPAAVRSVATLAATEPRLLAPGHGLALGSGAARALHSMADRLKRPGIGPLRKLRAAWATPRYGASVRYRSPPPVYARLQWIGHLLTRLGVSPRYVVTLEVPGRRSGVLRRTNLVLLDYHGQHYLVALAGESEWVRNVRAVGGGVILARGGRRWAVTLKELATADRADILRGYLWRGQRQPGNKRIAREAEVYFGLSGEPDLQQLRAVAPRYPVFRVSNGGAPWQQDRG